MKFCGLILPRDMQLQLDVLGMKHGLVERRVWGNDVTRWNMKL